MSNFNERVKELRTKLGLTQTQLAKLAGIPQSTIGQIENGRNKSSTKIVELANALQTTPEYLTHGVVSSLRESNVSDVGRPHLWSSNDPLPEDDYVFLPFYKDIALSAGMGCFSMDDHNGFKLPFAKATLRRNNVQYDQAACVTVSGNSMEPVLPDGATVSVNMADKRIVDGKMYAICQGDLLRVKRLFIMPNNKVRISSYNHEDHPDEIEDVASVEIIGRVFNWSVMDV